MHFCHLWLSLTLNIRTFWEIKKRYRLYFYIGVFVFIQCIQQHYQLDVDLNPSCWMPRAPGVIIHFFTLLFEPLVTLKKNVSETWCNFHTHAEVNQALVTEGFSNWTIKFRFLQCSWMNDLKTRRYRFDGCRKLRILWYKKNKVGDFSRG